ncbi:hypothetical protein ABZP36_005290 [Zizania latifolia]
MLQFRLFQVVLGCSSSSGSTAVALATRRCHLDRANNALSCLLGVMRDKDLKIDLSSPLPSGSLEIGSSRLRKSSCWKIGRLRQQQFDLAVERLP